MNILVVDDDKDILEALQIALELEGYSVKTAINSKQMLNFLYSWQPDVILLDILLSGEDGRDIAKNLKAQESTKFIPIIIVSAHPTAEQSVQECGANLFIEKPFSMDMLLSSIETFRK